MWCSTCGLDTATLDTVTVAFTAGDLARAARLGDAAHHARDGAHEPAWWPGDPMDDITAIHYHLRSGPDDAYDPADAASVAAHVAAAHRFPRMDVCGGGDYAGTVQTLLLAMTDYVESLRQDGIRHRGRCGCDGCVLTTTVTDAINKVTDVPAAMLVDAGHTVTVTYREHCHVTMGVARVHAHNCTCR